MKYAGAQYNNNRKGLRHARNQSDYAISLRRDELESPIKKRDLESYIQAPGGPTQMSSMRPLVEPFDYIFNHEPVFRIASWSLTNCSIDKISNPGVLEVICMTILEQGLSIILLQSLTNCHVAETIANQLNHPALRELIRWPGYHGSWSHVTEFQENGNAVSIIFDTSRNMSLVSSQPLHLPSDIANTVTVSPLLCKFRNNSPSPHRGGLVIQAKGDHQPEEFLDFWVVNAEFSTANFTESLASIRNLVAEYALHGNPLIFGIHFHHDDSDDAYRVRLNSGPCCDLLRLRNLEPLLPDDQPTDISKRRLTGSLHTANFLLNPAATKLFTGVHEVVRKALSHPCIPDGWSWGGLVSQHCPIWLQLYARSPQVLESTVIEDS